ncbi:hypothetical protein HZP39_04235 [Elizabethkingia anophelis]|nr:hypothetical protein [Elizabethkingia anophelis]MCT4239433.1 hypothetical protein [Elizabethkingia anophelis]MCT4281996.1 hypothetical protein [Elizabethkingia anophelis]MCT4292581.1 hypothetical protein [Elizabethkingia anophelis]
MEAKEKAEELLNKFENVDLLKDYDGMDKNLAIECAIICVGEFITDSSYDGRLESAQYWISVHQELLKMK